MDNRLYNGFLQLMKSAMIDATNAHHCVFPDSAKENRLLALSYAATAIAKSSAAEALYYAQPELEHEELPELFSQFDVFVREMQSDFETEHSAQWVDIEYNTLKDRFDNSVCSLPIVE
jgi:hypothetical protein